MTARSKSRFLREIRYLFSLALDSETPIELADRYVRIAFKIAMRTKTRLPRELKIFMCRRCKGVLRPGLTGVYRVRARPKKALVVKCLRCGYTRRYVYQ
jgi:ribonuclease P protein subunit RPR2